MVKLSIKIKLFLMLGLALISIGSINLYHINSQYYLTNVLQNSMLRSITLMQGIQELQDNGLNVISYHRAYLISGHAKDLNDFNHYSEKYLESIAKLKILFEQQPRDRVLVEKLEFLYIDWLNNNAKMQIESRRKIAEAKETYHSIATKVANREGKRSIDKIRHLISKLSKTFVSHDDIQSQLELFKLLKFVLDAETGQRGFIITGDDFFLEPYYAGVQNFNSSIDVLISRAKGKQQIIEQINQIKTIFLTWKKKTALPNIESRLVFNKYPVNLKSFAGLLSSTAGNEFIKQVNIITQVLENHTLKYVNDSIFQSNMKIKQTRWLSLIFVAISMFVLLFFFLILTRGISKSLRILTDGARKIGLGELSHKIVVDSNTELIELSNEFNQMGRSLKKQHIKLKRVSETDSLTGVLNRKTFEMIVNKHVAADRRGDDSFSFFFLDVDNFKTINDTYGHFVGDEILEALSRRLTLIIRETDYLARMGGDEFAILLTPIKSLEEAGVVAERVMQLCESKFDIDDVKHSINLSIGIASYPSDGRDFATLQKNADLALYKAKQSGRNQYQFFTQNIAKAFEKRKIIVDLLDEAFDDNFMLYFQPVFSVLEGEPTICGAEILLRVKNEVTNNIEEVISIAEETNNIIRLGNEIIDRVFAKVMLLKHKELNLRFAINLSVKQLQDNDFIPQLKYIMDTHDIDTKQVTFELTETVLMEDHFEFTSILKELRYMGYNLALDDYGKGYSSLARLRDLPINIIKLDMSFIRKLVEEPETQIIVKSTVELSNELGLKVVAEGVENEEQLRLLQDYQCHMVQGYLLGKPMSWGDFCTLLNDNFDVELIGGE